MHRKNDHHHDEKKQGSDVAPDTAENNQGNNDKEKTALPAEHVSDNVSTTQETKESGQQLPPVLGMDDISLPHQNDMQDEPDDVTEATVAFQHVDYNAADTENGDANNDEDNNASNASEDGDGQEKTDEEPGQNDQPASEAEHADADTGDTDNAEHTESVDASEEEAPDILDTDDIAAIREALDDSVPDESVREAEPPDEDNASEIADSGKSVYEDLDTYDDLSEDVQEDQYDYDDTPEDEISSAETLRLPNVGANKPDLTDEADDENINKAALPVDVAYERKAVASTVERLRNASPRSRAATNAALKRRYPSLSDEIDGISVDPKARGKKARRAGRIAVVIALVLLVAAVAAFATVMSTLPAPSVADGDTPVVEMGSYQKSSAAISVSADGLTSADLPFLVEIDGEPDNASYYSERVNMTVPIRPDEPADVELESGSYTATIVAAPMTVSGDIWSIGDSQAFTLTSDGDGATVKLSSGKSLDSWTVSSVIRNYNHYMGASDLLDATVDPRKAAEAVCKKIDSDFKTDKDFDAELDKQRKELANQLRDEAKEQGRLDAASVYEKSVKEQSSSNANASSDSNSTNSNSSNASSGAGSGNSSNSNTSGGPGNSDSNTSTGSGNSGDNTSGSGSGNQAGGNTSTGSGSGDGSDDGASM